MNYDPAAAERLARDAHATQSDRAGKPYVEHIERVVANLLRRWPDATVDEVSAAWLLDVIEDTPWDARALLQAGISAGAVEIVGELSRPAGSTYLAWIESLAALGSLSAVRVKLADNEDNSLPERVALIPDGAEMLAKRYQPARAILERRLQSSVGQ
jgi:(p)ppGpp synthase/HD superfamily hydrolase